MDFVHIVEKFIFYVNMKLLAEMTKIAKCLKLRYSIYFIRKKDYVYNYIHLLICYFSC
jgi:hypothetical protein